MTFKLLTEPEVAKLLRCSPQAVRRLRVQGRLTYIPGRPVKIDEADVVAFLERERLMSIEKHQPKGRTKEQQAYTDALAEALRQRAALARATGGELRQARRRKRAAAE